jgi:hypothetical protein
MTVQDRRYFHTVLGDWITVLELCTATHTAHKTAVPVQVPEHRFYPYWEDWLPLLVGVLREDLIMNYR